MKKAVLFVSAKSGEDHTEAPSADITHSSLSATSPSRR